MTAVHKQNVLRLSDGLFLDRVRTAAREAAMLLEWLSIKHGRPELARAHGLLEAAIDALVADPLRRTADLGGPLGTRAFGSALRQELVARLSAPA